MLSRYVLSFMMVAGAAVAAPHDGLVKGQTTVAQVEQGLGAPADTVMRPDGALTLIYPYARCSQQMPAAFPGMSHAAMAGRTVSLRFGADFRYRSAATGLTPSLASNETPARTLASK